MIESRSLEDLLPPVYSRMVSFIAIAEICMAENHPGQRIKLQVLSTYRDYEAQDKLYAQGRTAPGKIVTNARGGQSWHNHRCAADIGVVVDGKLTWDKPWYEELGLIAKEQGLTWGGDWNGDGVKQKADFDLDHFQWTGGLTLADLQAGKKIEDVA